jgi:hypothetical protein
MLNGSKLISSPKKNEMIKSWNILGPFDFDVSDTVQGLLFFEGERGGPNGDCQTGRKEFAAIFDKNLAPLSMVPSEGDTCTVYGIESPWKFLRSAEDVYTFGNFHTYNCFGAVFAHSVISLADNTAEDARVSFKLVQRNHARMTVYVDGKKVFDSERIRPANDPAGYSFRYFLFDADIKAAGSNVSLVCAKMCRWTDVGFGLCSTSHNLSARTLIPGAMKPEDRQALEDAIGSVEIDRELYYDADDLAVGTDVPGGIELSAVVSGFNDGKAIPLRPGYTVLCTGAELKAGPFTLTVTAKSPGSISASTTYDLYKVVASPYLPGIQNFEKRRKIYLELCAEAEESRHPAGASETYSLAACYYLGQYDKIPLETVQKKCQYIRNRSDCSDFRIQALLRILYWEREKRRLPDEVVGYIKETVLGFKYWQDEPGDTVMYFLSENHRLLFHAAEYLAGQLYPTEIFTNSGQNGLYHTAKARSFIMDWLRERGRYGFTEYHSNSYFTITLCPLLNLYDFIHPDDLQFRYAVKMVIDYMTLIASINTFEGAFATAHSRTYAPPAKHPEHECCHTLMYLLFGKGCIRERQNYSTFEIATGSYRLPPLFEEMAQDDKTRLWCKWQQGRYSHFPDRFSGRFAVYRTPYCQMSALLDYDYKGKFESALHTAHVGLPDKISVFWTSPWCTNESGGTRPSYWSGTASVPRSFQEKNVIGLIFKGKRYNWMSHCYFERARFDEVRMEGNWVFATIKGSYIGIYSQNGLSFTDSGLYKNRELVCAGTDNIWLCECGDVQQNGTFDNFVLALKSASVECSGDTVIYESPSIGHLEAGWDGQVTVNGKPLEMRGPHTVESEWVNGTFGEPHLRISYKGITEDIWFE